MTTGREVGAKMGDSVKIEGPVAQTQTMLESVPSAFVDSHSLALASSLATMALPHKKKKLLRVLEMSS